MNTPTSLRFFAAFTAVAALLIPASAFADTTIQGPPACLMASATLSGGQVVILWVSKDATTATDESGVAVSPVGYKFVSPIVTTTYAYDFKGAGGSTSCNTMVTVGNPVTVTTVASAPTVAASTPANGTGPLSISMLPLLTGGATGAANSIPVAYIKVSNRGTEATSINGFTLSNTGTASADADVIGFTTSDDKGGSRSVIGGVEGTQAVSGNSAFVPLAAVIDPGQIRIFTIKATLSAIHREIGKSLVFNVASADAGKAIIAGSFPLQGVSWVFSN